jgi:hypothetical protein
MNEQNELQERGYTSRSLEMLESAEGQLNAVFACFGSAAQHAQLLEQGLSRFLTTYNRVASDSVNANDIGNKMTMGQLLNKVKTYVKIDDDSIEQAFTNALEERNYLIHHFFLQRNPLLDTTEGRLELPAELVSIESNLDHCRVAINAMRIAMCKATGIDDDWACEYSNSESNTHSRSNIAPFSIQLEIERPE